MAPVSVPEHTPFSRPMPVAGALPIPGARELTALLDQSSELMAATARDGRITFANSAWLRALGEERGAMIGRPLRDLVVPAYRRGFVEGALRVLRGESVAGAELVLHRRDGRRVVCRARALPIRDGDRVIGAHVFCEDVTAQNQAEALRSRLATTLEASSDVVVMMTTADDRLVFLNRAARRLLGVADGAPARSVSIATFRTAEEHHRLSSEAVPAAVRDGVWEGESMLVPADGEPVPVSVVLVAHQSTHLGEPPYFVSAVMRDLRERVRAEKLKNQFVAMVSHELRTPLTAIRGSADLLNKRWAAAMDERGKTLVEMLIRNADRLARLVNDLVDMERIASGAVALELVPVEPRTLIGDAVEMTRPHADGAGIELRVGPIASHAVAADTGRVVQVLGNLITNAIKFSAAGTAITVGAEPANDGRSVVFVVRDEGRGIPRDHLASIFEPFEQVTPADARERGGAGLGLAICRAIVTQHGGRIWVESEDGAGSVFRFTIPTA